MYGTSKVSHGLAATQGSRADELKKRLVVTEEERRRGPRLDYIHSVALAVSGVSHMQRVACIIYSLRRGRAMHMEWPCGAWFEELGVCETNFQELMWVAPFFTGFCRPVSNERHETKTVRPFHSHQEEGHEPKKPLRRSVRVSGRDQRLLRLGLCWPEVRTLSDARQPDEDSFGHWLNTEIYAQSQGVLSF